MSLWLVLVVLTLATFRVTRLITRDDFPPIWNARIWLRQLRPVETRRYLDASGEWYEKSDYWWLGELVSCPWCASAYVSGAFVGTVWLLHGMPLPILCWLAVWGAAAAIAYVTDD
jgi:hypothetical protein